MTKLVEKDEQNLECQLIVALMTFIEILNHLTQSSSRARGLVKKSIHINTTTILTNTRTNQTHSFPP